MASRIAIVEDSTNGRMLIGALLASGHYDVTCMSTDDALESLAALPPSLILIGPSVGAPVAFIDQLKKASAAGAIPVIVLARDASPDIRLALIAAGARDVADYPASGTTLLARIRVLLREAEAYREIERRRLASLKFGFAEAAPEFATKRRITFVQDGSSQFSTVACGEAKTWATSISTPAEALAPEGVTHVPEGYILDWCGAAPQATIRQTLPELRSRSHSRHAVILVIHDKGDPDAAVQALDAGASDVVSDQVLPGEIVCRMSRLLKRKIAEDALRKSTEDGFEMAVTDPLTGLYNRRYAEAYMADLLAGQARERPFAFMIADIDHFKMINDTHGHAAGDDVLRDVAHRLRSEMRAIDLVARFGGEEFLIVLAETDIMGAELAANRLRQRIGSTPVSLENGASVDVTMSIGVCLGNASMVQSLRANGGLSRSAVWQNPLSELLRRADSALYQAKAEGRNRIQMAATSA